MPKKSLLVVLTIALCAAPGIADEPDFYLMFESCKTAIGYLVLSDESLKVIEGEPTTMECHRRGENISCTFVFPNGQKGAKGNSEDYKVVLDSPPHLYFATPNGSEFIAVDTSQHAAVLINRVIHEKFAGSKVCHGLYATSFEMKTMKK